MACVMRLRANPGDLTAEQIGEQINANLSIFRY